MASTSQCKYCGSTVSSDQKNCPNCGAPNDGYVADTPRTVFQPHTIEELKEYCAERGMPLLKMRFFVGEDYRQPKAFGIYRDGENFIVYKNKANGERAIRYQGPNETIAVLELYAKLMEECHNRGINPDGKFPTDTEMEQIQRKRKRKKLWQKLLPFLLLLIYLVGGLVMARISARNHRGDGYYSTGNGTVYYLNGDQWYYTYDENDAGYWYEADSFPADNYEDYALGEDWDSDWGVSNFKESSTWEQLQESHTSGSSDYESWDSNDTDWDSDW